jgi:hypothetical protein
VGLLLSQEFGGGEVFQVLMIRDDVDGGYRSLLGNDAKSGMHCG